MKLNVLCIDDDPVIQTLVEQCLKEYNVISAKSLKSAQNELLNSTFSAILIDINLPDGDGLRFYAKINQDIQYKKIPTFFLTSHTDISDKLMAFAIGADDYITKPFNPMELHARVSSKIKKQNDDSETKKIRQVGNLEIDFDRQAVFYIQNGKKNNIGLTAIELKILSFLSKRLEQVYSREQILLNVWGDTHITDRTIDSHIAHLRGKIENTNILIDTVKSFGYRAILKTK